MYDVLLLKNCAHNLVTILDLKNLKKFLEKDLSIFSLQKACCISSSLSAFNAFEIFKKKTYSTYFHDQTLSHGKMYK